MASRYGLLALATTALAVAGYGGYVLYPRFDLPAGAGAGLLLLAAAAGVASFFSPCSFPLLVSILARPPGGRGGIGRAAGFAAALSAGAAVFLLLFGALIGLVGGALFQEVTFTSAAGRTIRIVVGLFLVLLGLVQLRVVRVSLRQLEPALHGLLRRQAGLRRRRPTAGFALFGFGYLLAGFG